MEASRPTLALVVAAAGYGTRLDSSLPKQYVPVLGIPMLQRTLGALSDCPLVDALVVVVNPEDVDYCRGEIRHEQLDQKILGVVPGGGERAESVWKGLLVLAERGSWDLVGVHDGARPLITCAEIGLATTALATDETLDGAVLAIPSFDTVKVVDGEGIITETPDRQTLWRAQTPQIFRWKALMDAYTEVDEDGLSRATDDSSLVEVAGGRVKVVQGSTDNLKITDRTDLRHAEHILAGRRV